MSFLQGRMSTCTSSSRPARHTKSAPAPKSTPETWVFVKARKWRTCTPLLSSRSGTRALHNYRNAGGCLPKSGQPRSKSPRFGRIWVDVGRNVVEFGRSRATRARIGSDFDQNQLSLPGFNQIWAEVDRHGADFDEVDQIGPTPPMLGSKSAMFSPRQVTIDENWPESKFGPNMARKRPRMARYRPTLLRFRHI